MHCFSTPSDKILRFCRALKTGDVIIAPQILNSGCHDVNCDYINALQLFPPALAVGVERVDNEI